MEKQEQRNAMSPEESFASLGIATRLNEQYLMSQMPQEMSTEAPVDAQEPQGEQVVQEIEKEPVEETKEKENEDVEDKETVDDKVKKAVEEQLAPIKEALQKALEEDEG